MTLRWATVAARRPSRCCAATCSVLSTRATAGPDQRATAYLRKQRDDPPRLHQRQSPFLLRSAPDDERFKEDTLVRLRGPARVDRDERDRAALANATVALGRGESLGEMARDALNNGLLEAARARGKSSHRLWAVDDDPADLDVAEQRKALNVGEAERAPDLDLLTKAEFRQRGADVRDLFLDAGNQLGLVAAIDAEDRSSLGEEPAFPVAPDLSAVGLGVNDGDPPGSDGDVVDVRLTVAGDAAVMEQPHAGAVEQRFEADADPEFAIAALLPDAGARRLVGQLDQEGSEAAQLVPGALLTGVVPALVLPQRTPTRVAGIDRGVGAGSELGPGTAQAGDRPRCRVPDRRGADREIGGADQALIGTAQTQLLWGASRADENGIGRGRTQLDLNQRMVEREARCGSAEW